MFGDGARSAWQSTGSLLTMQSGDLWGKSPAGLIIRPDESASHAPAPETCSRGARTLHQFFLGIRTLFGETSPFVFLRSMSSGTWHGALVLCSRQNRDQRIGRREPNTQKSGSSRDQKILHGRALANSAPAFPSLTRCRATRRGRVARNDLHHASFL